MNLCLYAGPQANVALERVVPAAAQAGFVCLNLWAPGLEAMLASHPLSWLDDLLQTYGLYPATISGLEPLNLYPGSDYALFQSHFIDLCSCLDALGGGIVVVVPGSLADQRGTQQTGLERALQRLSDLATPFDVRIAVNLQAAASRPPGSGWDPIQQIVSLLNLPNVGIALNVQTVRLDEEGLAELDALLVEKLWLVDLQDSSVQSAPPAKTVEFTAAVEFTAKVCRRLASRGFQGPFSVELMCQESDLEQKIWAARQAALALFRP